MGRRGAPRLPLPTQSVMERAESVDDDGIVKDCQCPSCSTRRAVMLHAQHARMAPKRRAKTVWSENISRLFVPPSLDMWRRD